MHRSEEALRRMRLLPTDLQNLIISFVPRKPAPKPIAGLQRELEKLQKSPKRTSMDLKGLEDFVLQ
jgi:hypothetical protein